MSRPISAAYLERKLRAIVGVQGSNPLPELEDIGRGLIVLENDRPEWRFPANEFWWGIARSIGPVGGQQSFIGVHNRPGSGILTVVTRITISAAGTGFEGLVGINFPDSGQPGDGVVFARDGRFLLTGGFLGTRRFEGTSVAPTTGSLIRRVNLAPNTSIVLDEEVVLPPNSELHVTGTPGNVAITVSLEGYERPLEGTVEMR